MISLFIDTSTNHLIVGLYENEKNIFLDNENTTNDLSSKVLPTLKNALEESNLSLNKIDKLYVVNGPGSFTGIRVGVTIAKTLAYSLNKKIYPISELMLLSTTQTDKNYIVPIIDARRGYVYGAIYDKNLNPILKDCYIKLEELLKEVEKISSLDKVSFVSYDQFENCVKPDICIEKLFKQNLEAVNPHLLNPNYLKKTEAEEKLHQ